MIANCGHDGMPLLSCQLDLMAFQMDVDSCIDVIARALAERDARGGSRATAMVGAGFSRNAQPRRYGAKNFPLWRDVVNPLIDELVPPCQDCLPDYPCARDGESLGHENCVRRQGLFLGATGASGMMALGDKFEAKMGRARLRSALESAIPDQDYVPGVAHQLLVRLPWADILTTNWDSLLERAVDDYDRSYGKVVTVEQIASASAPRIVKLHGCARSGSELIFTEEAYRTYPQAYAPFVALVQQSLMENVVVLFGFSGSDPNFRAWHGWVRDNLRHNMPPIYMVSLKPIEPIDVNLMGRRLITQINLSEKWGSLQESALIEEFLSEIKKRISNFRINLDWPIERNGDEKQRIAPRHDWRKRMESYPRWLVAPTRNRANLVTFSRRSDHLRVAGRSGERVVARSPGAVGSV